MTTLLPKSVAAASTAVPRQNRNYIQAETN